MHPKNISIADYTYKLPAEKIAKYPLENRDDSKLLVYNKGQIEQTTYSTISEHIPTQSLLVFNNTKVVEARMLFTKATGGIIEIFCLEPHKQYADITTAMLTQKTVWWKCLVGGASKWKQGIILEKTFQHNGNENSIQASIIERLTDGFIVQFNWQPQGLSFAEILHFAGAIPLPPYLNRQAEEADKTRYQTIFARHDGSVAAPTAGLHFTEKVFAALAQKEIEKEFITLHVGAGTFKPVKSETLAAHEMHAEFMEITIANLNMLIRQLNHTIIAVGTTSLRTIESLFWIGVKLINNITFNPNEIAVSQWDPYEVDAKDITPLQALLAVKNFLETSGAAKLVTRTQIMIAPGYKLKIATAIVTNFHQPQSTLLLLIAAIIGDEWKHVYDVALQNGYRFLSYGDGCLLWNNTGDH